MTDKLAYMTEAEWIALLDEIRKKGGTTDKMTAEQARKTVEALKIGGEDNLRKRLTEELTEVSYDDITSIPAYAFSGCDKLKTVNLPNVTELGRGAFQYISAFGENALSKINMPKVTIIPENCFYQSQELGDISFVKNVVIIDKGGFYGAFFYELADSIEFPALETIKEEGLAGFKSSEKLILPKVKNIYKRAFVEIVNSRRPILKEVYAPKLISVEEEAFYKQLELKTFICGGSAEIEEYAFNKTAIRSVVIGPNLKLASKCFGRMNDLKVIKIKINGLLDYGTGWSDGNFFGEDENIEKVWISKDTMIKLNNKEGFPSYKCEIYCESTDGANIDGTFKCSSTIQKVNYGVTEAEFDEIIKKQYGEGILNEGFKTVD